MSTKIRTEYTTWTQEEASMFDVDSKWFCAHRNLLGIVTGADQRIEFRPSCGCVMEPEEPV